MKKIVLIASALVASVAPLHAEIETSISADVVSEYVWRGVKCGDAAIQPTLAVSAAGVELSAWGSVGIANLFDTKELDLTLSYSIAGASVGVTDYWFSAGTEPYGRYFKYKEDATNHVFEAFAGYDFGFASISLYADFAGNDFKANGDRAFSSYCAPMTRSTPRASTQSAAVTLLSLPPEIPITALQPLPFTSNQSRIHWTTWSFTCFALKVYMLLNR